ncbi:MAG: peptidase S11 [Deltaproteobacteria bacterium HGW-Deltaproteobacteria-13]|jgi:D-alanyl-D-alanine endopeptidase (penicillin-binding protein 7)|nr:MAG: peptidase S11 [Deltaproteobacteria bacterium HGW-Deltaproteobacteria-13]
MASKYGKATLVIVLCFSVLFLPVSTGFSKSSKHLSSHRKHLIVESERVPGKLVLRSAAVLVEDQLTGECLVRKKAAVALPIASITKLMTAMVVIDANMDLEESINIEATDVDTLRHSHSRMSVGTQLTRREALLLALMSSDNRSAHALGRTYQGGLEACITAMNAKARSLGLLETRFDDPTGLSSGNVSSARDLVRLVDTAYQYYLIREFTTCKETAIQSGGRMLEFRNTNRLIQNPHWQIGLSKTGFIGEAGRCLVMQAHLAQRPVLIVLLDSQGTMTRIGDANRIKRWLEARSPSQRAQKG